MTNYQPGDLVLVAFPVVQGGVGKQRPALVIADTGDDDVVLARVTTQMHGSACDVALTEWQQAGLLAPSVVRLHKLATLEKTLVARKFGQTTAADRAKIAPVLRQLLGGW